MKTKQKTTEKKKTTAAAPDAAELVEVEVPEPERARKTCSVQGCTKPHRAKGLCSTHYNEQRPAAEAPAAAPEAPAEPPAEKPKAPGWKVALGAVLGVAAVGALGGALYLTRERRGPAQIFHFPRRGEA